MSILEIQNVVKRYDDYVAVDHISFNVPKGKIFGLLGPNGAGKTSLIRIITTIVRPDEGQVIFNGEVLNDTHPEQIGYMAEERGLYKKMEVGEILMYLAQLKGLSKEQAASEIDMWLKKFGIENWWTKKIEELSKGMQQKIQFITTVVHKPPLLILDEPFSGLDPLNTNLIKDEIKRLCNEGTSIIFSTHRMEQVEEIAEEIVLINQGQKILEGNVKDIKQNYKKHHFQLDFEGELPDSFEKFNIISKENHKVVIKLSDEQSPNQILHEAVSSNMNIIAFNEILPTLNEIFIHVTSPQNT